MATTISSSFSSARYGLLLRKEWGENRRQLLLLTFLCVGMMAVASFCMTLADYNYIVALYSSGETLDFATGATGSYRHSGYHSAQRAIFTFITLAFTTLAASLAFASTAGKEGALREIECPALQSEKFAARFTVYIIGAWIAAIAGWATASFGTFFVMDAFTPYGGFFFPKSLGPLFDGTSLQNITPLFCIILTVLFLQSLFFLGSTVWPRSSFIKTFAAGFAITVCMITIALTTTNAFIDIINPVPPPPAFFNSIFTYAALSLIMTTVNYIVAFLRYRESEVIRRW